MFDVLGILSFPILLDILRISRVKFYLFTNYVHVINSFTLLILTGIKLTLKVNLEIYSIINAIN